MDKKTIDQFFDSLSKDVLKEKWHEYDKYSNQKNSVTISELLEVWNVCYENTFVYHKPDLLAANNLIKEESETYFGLFFLYLSDI